MKPENFRANALHIAGNVFLISFAVIFGGLLLLGVMVAFGAPYE